MISRKSARAAVDARIFSGAPFTFTQLSLLCEDVEDMKDPWRVADGALQHFRKKGLISFRREGRKTIWSLTEAGRTEAAARTAAAQ